MLLSLWLLLLVSTNTSSTRGKLCIIWLKMTWFVSVRRLSNNSAVRARLPNMAPDFTQFAGTSTAVWTKGPAVSGKSILISYQMSHSLSSKLLFWKFPVYYKVGGRRVATSQGSRISQVWLCCDLVFESKYIIEKTVFSYDFFSPSYFSEIEQVTQWETIYLMIILIS